MVEARIKAWSSQMTMADEIFGRLYYVVTSCADIAQTVAKVGRSILGSKSGNQSDFAGNFR